MRSATPKITGDIEFQDFSLDEQFEAILPERARNFYHKIAVRGQADGRATFRSPSSKLPVKYRSAIEASQIDPMDLIDLNIWARLTDGRILYEEFPYELKQVDAQVVLNNDELHVESLMGYHDQSKISLKGIMNRSGLYDLSITGEPLLFDESLREAFGEQEKQFWDKYSPYGTAELSFDLSGQSSQLSNSAETSDRDYRAVIRPIDFGLDMARLKYPLDNITGTIVAEPNYVGLVDLMSVKDAQRISLSGEVIRRGSIKEYDVQVQTWALEMDELLQRALPTRLKNLWRTYEPGGRLDLDLDITSQQDDEEGGIWNISGQSSIVDGRLNQPMPAENIEGLFIGSAQYNSATGTFDLTGEAQQSSLLLKQRSLSNLTGGIHYDGQRQELIFSDIS
ncbi:MAG: hypothetical protein GY869_21090, partial [Planctomycetes bacterium]|nr:hypothetical protein [Planctomycetota bacterium]